MNPRGGQKETFSNKISFNQSNHFNQIKAFHVSVSWEGETHNLRQPRGHSAHRQMGGGISPRTLQATKIYELIFKRPKNISSTYILYPKPKNITNCNFPRDSITAQPMKNTFDSDMEISQKPKNISVFKFDT